MALLLFVGGSFEFDDRECAKFIELIYTYLFMNIHEYISSPKIRIGAITILLPFCSYHTVGSYLFFFFQYS